MKSSLKYLKLWQKKRSELRINDNPQGDWLQMQQLLDQHLPVSKPAGSGKPFHGLNLKLLTTLFVSAAAAATIIYFAAHRPGTKMHKVKLPGKDTTLNSLVSDSIVKKDTSIDKTPGNRLTGKADTAAVDTLQRKQNQYAAGHMLLHDSLTLQNKNAQQQLINQNKNQPGTQSQYMNKHYSRVVASNQIKNNQHLFAGSNTKDTMLNSVDNTYQPGLPGGRQSLIVPYGSNFSFSNTNLTNSSRSVFNSGALVTDHKLFNASGFSKIKVNQVKSSKNKDRKLKSSTPLNIDWGILAGANSPGTSKIPNDLFFGAFATFNIKNNWAVNTQLRLFSPQSITGSYTHPYEGKVDTNLRTMNIKDSRTLYSVELPLYIEYKATNKIRFKAGPVISFPVKQSNGKSILLPDSIRKDTAYFVKTNGTLSKTKFEQRLNYGLSAGASINFNRFIFEATYLKRFGTQKIFSDLGIYSSSSNTFQFTVGFKLNKAKP